MSKDIMIDKLRKDNKLLRDKIFNLKEIVNMLEKENYSLRARLEGEQSARRVREALRKQQDYQTARRYMY